MSPMRDTIDASFNSHRHAESHREDPNRGRKSPGFRHGCYLVMGMIAGMAAFIPNFCAAEDEAPVAKEMEKVWSVAGGWSGVVGDERDGVIYASATGGKCVELDASWQDSARIQSTGEQRFHLAAGRLARG